MTGFNRRQAIAATTAVLAAPTRAGAAPLDMEAFVGPLPGWKDARRDFGAVGDGRADDTAALQRALDSLVASGSMALYLPAGRYRITRTLVLPRRGARQAIGLNIQGEDPGRTVLVWDGPREGRMVEYGAWYSKLGRLTFDGQGRAGIALAHGTEFVTANEIADCVFQDVDVGIEAGTPEHAGIAETSVLRCRFLRCSTAGASLRNFNSLDWWFRQCRFEDCQFGLTNLYGAGNFFAYDSVFLRSREADIAIRNTGYLSFRDNLSIGSKAFFLARAVDAGAHLTFQGNRIYDTDDVAAIKVGNLGPVILLDNLIVSRPGQAGPAVDARSAIGVAVGNRFSATQPLALKAGSTVLDNSRVGRSAASPPPPAPFAVRHTGAVTTIPVGTSPAAIQAAIDAAARRGGGVIHFAQGSHSLDRTLTIPADAAVRLVGEGFEAACRINWVGTGGAPMIRLAAPSRARIDNLTLFGGGLADGVELAGLDRAGGPLLFDQVKAGGCADTGFMIDRLAKTTLVLRDTDHHGCGVGLRAIGNRAPVIISAGASSDNVLSYALSEGARLLARDIWYESAAQPGFMRLTGSAEFTLNGSNIATPRRADNPPVSVRGLQGQAVFLGVIFTGGPESLPAVVAEGGDDRQQLLLLGTQGQGEYFADRSGRASRIHGLTTTASGGARPLPDRGLLDPAALRRLLSLARMQEPRDQGPPRLYRVYLDRCRTGARMIA
jgi:hypothetical protein